MTIGKLAELSDVNAKLIRHYESIGLLTKPSRTSSGYRIYTSSDVHILKFIKSARNLGFGMKEIKKLMGLWKNKSRTSAEVKKLVSIHIEELERKIEELNQMAIALKRLAKNCHGNDRPECPILEELEKKGKV